MPRPLLYALVLWLLATGSGLAVQLPGETTRALEALDRAIDRKPHYHLAAERRVAALKRAAHTATGARRAALLRDIVAHYTRVQTDSALHYLTHYETSGLAQGTPSAQAYAKLARARIYGVEGLYAEGERYLQQVDPAALDSATRCDYYNAQRTLAGWLAGYAADGFTRQRLKARTAAFRDSVLRYERSAAGLAIVLADRALAEGRPEEALAISTRDLAQRTGAERAYVLYNLAECYRQLGDTARYIAQLARTATTDIENGITEYAALPLLAQLLHTIGDTPRAYTYLLCTMEDANLCNARLRMVEASNIFPIIDRAYKDYEALHRRHEKILFAATLLVALMLGGGIYSLRKSLRRLRTARHALLAANEELARTNEMLHSVDKIKEEYIARYLSRCRSYIDRLEEYRRTLLRMVKSREYDALYKELKSEQSAIDERQRFYADFDSAFLNLFPDFIERFNALLPPEAQVLPRAGEQLSTELRIFALIRLGVTDSARIAHFLNFSLATIYNYRSRVRQKALCGKADFEARVAML